MAPAPPSLSQRVLGGEGGWGEGRDWLLCENQALLCMLITRLDEGSVAFILYSQTQTQPSAGITLQQVHITFYIIFSSMGWDWILRRYAASRYEMIRLTWQAVIFLSEWEMRRMELICVSLSVLRARELIL